MTYLHLIQENKISTHSLYVDIYHTLFTRSKWCRYIICSFVYDNVMSEFNYYA